MTFRLERLRADHPVASFDCGSTPEAAAIAAFLGDRAAVQQAAGWSSTTVAIDAAAQRPQDVIVGYFALSPCSLRADRAVLETLGLGAAYPQVGGYLLGRLGIAVHHQRQGLGALLVERAIDAACQAWRLSGGVFLAVDAKTEGLAAWYERLGYGFTRLAPGRLRLVMGLPQGWVVP